MKEENCTNNRSTNIKQKKIQKHRIKLQTLLVYGGSFDPVHLGHIGAMKIALKAINPDLFLIAPAFRNPFKSHIKHSTHQRTKWLKRSIKAYIKDKRVQLCLFEIKRNAPTPTITTIDFLYKTYNVKKIYFLIGTDHYPNLHTWDEFPRLKQLVEFLFVQRNGYPLPPRQYRILPFNHPASSTQIRQGRGREFLPQFLKGLR